MKYFLQHENQQGRGKKKESNFLNYILQIHKGNTVTLCKEMSLRSNSSALLPSYKVNTVRMATMRCPRHSCEQETVEQYMERLLRLMSGTERIHTVFEHFEIIEVLLNRLTLITIFYSNPYFHQNDYDIQNSPLI